MHDVLLDLGVAPQHHLDELVEVDGAVAVLVHVPAVGTGHSHSSQSPSLGGRARRQGQRTDEPRRTRNDENTNSTTTYMLLGVIPEVMSDHMVMPSRKTPHY